MALNNPRDFVTGMRWSECDFGLVHDTVGSRKQSGDIPRLHFGVPYWTAEWVSVPVSRDDLRKLRSWYRSVEGGSFAFLGYDVSREHPSQYVGGNGLGAWDGQASVTALGTNTIDVSGALMDMDLRAGDLVGLVEGDKRHLHEIREDVVLSALGAGQLSVNPYVLTNVFTTAATAYFVRPSVRFIMETGSWSGVPSMEVTPGSFKAVQEVPV